LGYGTPWRCDGSCDQTAVWFPAGAVEPAGVAAPVALALDVGALKFREFAPAGVGLLLAEPDGLAPGVGAADATGAVAPTRGAAPVPGAVLAAPVVVVAAPALTLVVLLMKTLFTTTVWFTQPGRQPQPPQPHHPGPK